VAAQFVARPIDWVRVKGKTKPVACYEVFGEAGRVPPSEERLAAAFAQAMAAYREGRFAEALDQFQATEPLEATASPGAVNPSRLYQGRCRQLLAYLPAAWDGVWTLGTK
jgi:hypothetical protein